MEKIKSIISDNKETLDNKKVSTQPVEDPGQSHAAEGLHAFNIRGAPPPILGDAGHEGDKEWRNKQAATWNEGPKE